MVLRHGASLLDARKCRDCFINLENAVSEKRTRLAVEARHGP